MAPRANWKGFLRLSLVTCPVALYPATSDTEKVSFNQINRKTGHRIKYLKVDAETEKKLFTEVYRVLKPGAYVSACDWAMTTKYDPSDEAQRVIKLGIEEGDGVANLDLTTDFIRGLEEAGFEIVE